MEHQGCVRSQDPLSSPTPGVGARLVGQRGSCRLGAEFKAAIPSLPPCSPGYKYPRKHRAPWGHTGSSAPAAPAPAVHPGHPLALLGANGVTRHSRHGTAQRGTAWQSTTQHGAAQRAQHQKDSTSILPSAEHTDDSQHRAEPISRALMSAAHQAAACCLHPSTVWVQSAPAANPEQQSCALCLALPGSQLPHSRAVGWQAGSVPHCPRAPVSHMAAGNQNVSCVVVTAVLRAGTPGVGAQGLVWGSPTAPA